MAMSREGAQTRLRTLGEISGYLGQAVKGLNIYEGDWGAEGFVHSILELTHAAYSSLETSKAILQEFVKASLYSKKNAQEEDDDFGNVEVAEAAPYRAMEPMFDDFRAILHHAVLPPRQ